MTVLNWGLGHATRSMPLIHRFLNEGNEVFLASDGRALKLLESEFPQLTCLKLPSYGITYRSSNMVWNMAIQMPRITYAALAEHHRIRQWQKKYQFDMILSDNRFGTFHPRGQSVFMSHQLNLPIDNPFLAWMGNLANRFWMSRYNEIWVPDFEGENNISGKLSHPSPFKNTKYLGVLTRFRNMNLPKKYKITIILSGPEPMRTNLEKILLHQIKNIEGRILIIQGKTENQIQEKLNDNIEIISFLNAEELNKVICESEIIISRSGYSTLMDLSVIKNIKAILIPTPGQTEQVYLAEHFHSRKIFMMMRQEKIDLKKGIKEIEVF